MTTWLLGYVIIVAQLTVWLLSTPEEPGSNPVNGNFKDIFLCCEKEEGRPIFEKDPCLVNLVELTSLAEAARPRQAAKFWGCWEGNCQLGYLRRDERRK